MMGAAMSNFKMTVEEVAGVPIVRLSGSLGVPAIASFERGLLGVSARKDKLVILDMKGVTFLCSLAMGAMVAFRNGIVRHSGKCMIAEMSPEIAEAFRRPKLHLVFDVRDTVAQCLPTT
jgi:anti-anti-sigma factor